MIRARTFLLGVLICLSQISYAATLVVLDVGEGQSVLLKDGADAILVDTGHAGAATSVLKALEKYKVTELKAIVLTHLHPDHVSGWFRLHEAFPDAATFYSGHKVAPFALDDVSRWVFEAITNLPNYLEIGMGDSIPVGRCTVDVIWPEDPNGLDLNYNSLVLSIDCDGTTALLMADANRSVEEHLISGGYVDKGANLLVVGHHGAADATSPKFISKIRPEFAAISVNAENIRGYPAESSLAALMKMGTKIFRTDLNGDLCFHATTLNQWQPCYK